MTTTKSPSFGDSAKLCCAAARCAKRSHACMQVRSPTCGASCELVLHSPCHTTDRSVWRGPLDLVPRRVGLVKRSGARPLPWSYDSDPAMSRLTFVTTTKSPSFGDFAVLCCAAKNACKCKIAARSASILRGCILACCEAECKYTALLAEQVVNLCRTHHATPLTALFSVVFANLVPHRGGLV